MFLMGFVEVVLVSFALALDAFAVSISCGIKINCWAPRKFAKIAASFGFFQGLMPFLGWSVGHLVKNQFGLFAPYIAGSVFGVLGIKTLWDALKAKEGGAGDSCKEKEFCACNSIMCLMGLSVATSIDAFLVGIVFSLLNVNLFLCISTIAAITLSVCYAGLVLGQKSGNIFGKKATVAAGVILLALALKSVVTY
jgi:putative Mn2+ efflux pump MntP